MLAPWKQFFETLWFLSCFIPVRKWRRAFRDKKLFGYRDKLVALRNHYHDLNWKNFRLAKGGGSLAFIVDNKYVFKVRKFQNDAAAATEKFMYEKRITDAIAPIVPVAVPRIDVCNVGGYVVYATEFIPGRIMLDLPMKKIMAHRQEIAKTLGRIIYALFNAELPGLSDLRPQKQTTDIGLVHGDMCSNILVNPDTMEITGIIDWEWAHFGSLWDEFHGIYRVRKKMRLTDIAPIAMWEYYKLRDSNK